jgi:folylpolyglutamate synthase/dihydropteroate synthase
MGTALAVCEALGIRPQPDRFELPEFRARCEVVRRAPLVILDAAHNADSARRLVEAVRELFPDERFTIVLGVVKGKDVAGIVRELSALRPQLVLTNPDTPKGSELERLVQEAEKAGLCYRIVPNLRRRDQLPQGENLLFTGSFFTAVIGERLFTPA